MVGRATLPASSTLLPTLSHPPPPSPSPCAPLPPSLTFSASEVRALLADPAATAPPTASTPDFWVLLAALRAFIAAEGGGNGGGPAGGSLPLDGGALPDMVATTDLFVSLSRLYRAKADADADALAAHVGRILISAGRAPDAIPAASVRTFCRNARCLRVVRPPPLGEAWAVPGSRGAAALASALAPGAAATPAAAAATLLVLTRAADAFAAAHGGRFPGGVVPGSSSGSAAAPSASAGSQHQQPEAAGTPPPPPPPIPPVPEAEVEALSAGCAAVLAALGGGSAASQGGGGAAAPPPPPPLSLPPGAAADAARGGGGELHAVASIIGGFAAQEGIKLLTRQFVPVGGALVFDGARAVTAVLEGV